MKVIRFNSSYVKIFTEKLKEKRYSVRQFNPAGQDDIGGGCGQLWFVQEWLIQHGYKNEVI